jgi:hypothetical protein
MTRADLDFNARFSIIGINIGSAPLREQRHCLNGGELVTNGDRPFGQSNSAT